MTSVETLNIPAAKIKQLQDKGIYTLEDLLKYFPKEYLDFTQESAIGIHNLNKNVAVVGILKSVEHTSNNKGIKCIVNTSNGISLTVMWFNQEYLYERLKYIKGAKVIVCGKLTRYDKNFTYSMVNPFVFSRAIDDSKKIFPVYKKIPGMSDDYLKSLIDEARKKVICKETLSDEIKKEFRLCDYEHLFDKIHSPQTQEDINQSKRRLIFEDMYYFANKLYQESSKGESTPYIISKTDITKNVILDLPYKLTDDQRDAVKEIKEAFTSGEKLNALVQGDVGSGKTIVSFLSMFLCAENGFQSVLLAPTQVLANQHFLQLQEMGEKYGFKTVFLRSKMRVKEKREALESIENGTANFIVGTHSVFSDNVNYKNLALVITDEEHKFGVTQREALLEKCANGVHSITMSATPIPRSLALTLYGVDKKVLTISQMPNGRKPVHTEIINDDSVINNFMLKKIKEGQQCYVVCPFVTKSNKESMENVKSVEEIYEKLSKWLKNNAPEVSIAVINGKMKSADIEVIINDYAAGNIDILIATTIVEVGVNVPNANVIVIENAERFGLAQLHQLRGRVGRGNQQGFCILHSQEYDNERLYVMCKTTNGFEIAEADLQNRGTGDLIGTVQSGYNKYVDLILAYPKFFNKVKKYVEKNFFSKT